MLFGKSRQPRSREGLLHGAGGHGGGQFWVRKKKWVSQAPFAVQIGLIGLLFHMLFVINIACVYCKQAGASPNGNSFKYMLIDRRKTVNSTCTQHRLINCTLISGSLNVRKERKLADPPAQLTVFKTEDSEFHWEGVNCLQWAGRGKEHNHPTILFIFVCRRIQIGMKHFSSALFSHELKKKIYFMLEYS